MHGEAIYEDKKRIDPKGLSALPNGGQEEENSDINRIERIFNLRGRMR